MKFHGAEIVVETYTQQFGRSPELVVSAPGRVNVIGEHTDYNDGFVLPMAIDRRVAIGGQRRGDDQVRLYSANFREMADCSVTSLHKEQNWADYVKGVIDEFRKAGHAVSGFDAVIYGDVPRGSGLSSSAAIEVATAFWLAHIQKIDMTPEAMAKLCQRAENRFVGMNCGIMDQFISRLGKENSVLYIDCRDLRYQQIPFDLPGYTVVICNSNVDRKLVNSAYNERRSQCEEGVRILQTQFENISALRDVSVAQLEQCESLFPPIVYRRCKHIVTENARVTAAVAALRQGDFAQLGQLLNQSHDSLRDDFAVSCRELDLLVDIARSIPGTLGARMTGAGFGGCTISLVRESNLEQFQTRLRDEYGKRAGILADIYVSKAEDGARIEQ